jgi:two-component system, NarL family, invasion response regulator UvrY
MSRIFILDDHAIVRQALGAVLVAAGHRLVGEAGTIAEALPLLARVRPEVLLLDLSLGAETGMTVLQHLRHRGAAVHTLVLSMSAQPAHVDTAFRLGAMGYMLKDAGTSELLQAVDTVARGQRFTGTGVEFADSAPAGLDMGELSPRELEVLALVVQGHTSAAIAEQLHLSPKSVETYRSRLMQKLGANNLVSLVRIALRRGLVA